MKLGAKTVIGARLLTACALRRRVPLLVGWSVTERCNAACGYCDKWRDEDPACLSTEEALALVDQLAAAGTRLLSLSGGEALLRDDLPAIVRRARQRGILCSLNTNGRLLPARIAALGGLGAVTVSVDTPDRAGDAVRGAGSFDRAMAALEVARSQGVPVSMVAVLSEHNLDRLDDLLALAQRLGTSVTFQPVDFLTTRKAGPHPHAPRPAGMRRAIDRLIEAKRAGGPVGNTIPGLRHLRLWPGPAPMGCAGGLITCNVESDGRVYACSRLQDDVPAQHASTHGFAQAWRDLRPVDCGRCWCARRVELNQLWALSLPTLLALARG